MAFAVTQAKVARMRSEKQTYRLNSRPWMWPSFLSLAVTLTLHFQGQIWNLLYLSQNGPIATKRKANMSNLGLKCGHWVWHWPWPWPWIFIVKLWNSRIWGIGRPIDIERKGPFMTMTGPLVTKVTCSDLPDSDPGDYRCRRVVDSSSCLYYSARVDLYSHQILLGESRTCIRRTIRFEMWISCQFNVSVTSYVPLWFMCSL